MLNPKNFLGFFDIGSAPPKITTTSKPINYETADFSDRKFEKFPDKKRKEKKPVKPEPKVIPPSYVLKSGIDDIGFDAAKAVDVYHETTMISCLFLLQKDRPDAASLTSYVGAFRSAYAMSNRPFKADIGHIAMIAMYLEATGTNPTTQYAVSRAASTDKFFKSLLVQNGADGVAYVTVAPEEVQHCTPETLDGFMDNIVPCVLASEYPTEVNNYLAEQFQLPSPELIDIKSEVESIIEKEKLVVPADNTTYHVPDGAPGLLQEIPVPRGDHGRLTLAVMEVDRMMGDTSSFFIVQDSPVAAYHDPRREDAYPAARLIPSGPPDGNPSFTFCAYVSGFSEVRKKFYQHSHVYEMSSKAHKEQMSVLARTTAPYCDARDRMLDTPYLIDSSERRLTFYKKGMSSAEEIAAAPNYLHITNINTYVTARREGFVGHAYVIDPRTFLVLVVSSSLLRALSPPNIDCCVEVPVRTGGKAENLSKVTSYAAVAIMVQALFPESEYSDKMKKLVALRGKEFLGYYTLLLERFAFNASRRKTLVCIPWYKYKLHRQYVDSSIIEDAIDSLDPDGMPPDEFEDPYKDRSTESVRSTGPHDPGEPTSASTSRVGSEPPDDPPFASQKDPVGSTNYYDPNAKIGVVEDVSDTDIS